METLRAYLNQLSTTQQAAYAKRCGTTIGYLRKAISKDTRLGESLVINLERESDGVVSCESIRPDVDWHYLRTRGAPPAAASRSHRTRTN